MISAEPLDALSRPERPTMVRGELTIIRMQAQQGIPGIGGIHRQSGALGAWTRSGGVGRMSQGPAPTESVLTRAVIPAYCAPCACYHCKTRKPEPQPKLNSFPLTPLE